MKLYNDAPAFSVQGLTIRAEIASRCLAALLSDSTQDGSWEAYAADAIACADALIAQLNEEE